MFSVFVIISIKRISVMLLTRGRIGRVTNCVVRGLWFKSPGSILLEQKPVLYHEWSGMVETHALYR